VSLEKYKSQVKAVEVTVNSKEENFKILSEFCKKIRPLSRERLDVLNNNKLESSASGG
jgi:hypothetical protein